MHVGSRLNFRMVPDVSLGRRDSDGRRDAIKGDGAADILNLHGAFDTLDGNLEKCSHGRHVHEPGGLNFEVDGLGGLAGEERMQEDLPSALAGRNAEFLGQLFGRGALYRDSHLGGVPDLDPDAPGVILNRDPVTGNDGETAGLRLDFRKNAR